MKYEYVVGVKTTEDSLPTVYSAQTLSMNEATMLVREWNKEEQRKAREEGRDVTRQFVGLFRVIPPWQEMYDPAE